MFLPKQKGVALVLALLIIGLVAAIAVTLNARLNRDIQRTALLQNDIRAESYAQSSLAWEADKLAANWIHRKTTTPVDKMPVFSPTTHRQDYSITSRMEDAQSRFNINNLNNEEWCATFKRLLCIIEPRLTPEAAQQITQSLRHWISSQTTDTEEEAYYSQLPEPYLAPHRPMASIAEMRLVKNMVPDLYQKILPYVTALPGITTLNINTAALPLLQSLSPNMSAENALALERLRQQTVFNNTEQFSNNPLVRSLDIPAGQITVNSEYFLVKTAVETQNQHLTLHSLLWRKIENATPFIEVVWQHKN